MCLNDKSASLRKESVPNENYPAIFSQLFWGGGAGAVAAWPDTPTERQHASTNAVTLTFNDASVPPRT